MAPGGGPYAQAQAYPGASPAGAGYTSPQPQPDQQAAIAAAWAQYYQQQQLGVPSASNGGASPAAVNATPAGTAGAPTQSPEEAAKIAAAWQAYYAAQAQYAQQMAANGWTQQQIQQAQAQAAGQDPVQQAQLQPQQSIHQSSNDGYANEHVRADNASVRSLSGPSAPQRQSGDHAPYDPQTSYGHQSRASLTMPQPQVYGNPVNQSQTSLDSYAPPPPAKDDPLLSAAPSQVINMTASPQPMLQGNAQAGAPPQTDNPWAHNNQHGQSSGSFGGHSGYPQHTASAPGQPGMTPSNPHQSPRKEAGQAGQSQTGLETAVADLAFR